MIPRNVQAVVLHKNAAVASVQASAKPVVCRERIRSTAVIREVLSVFAIRKRKVWRGS